MRAALLGEWLKLRSVRGTWWALLVLACGVAGAAALTGYAVSQVGAHPQLALSPMEPVVAQLAEVTLAVVAVLAATTDLAGDGWRATLVALPRRGRVVAAKAVVVGVLTLAATGVALVVTSVLTQAMVGDRQIRVFSDPGMHTSGLLVARVATVVAIALSALGVALWLRSTAGAVTAVCVVLFVLPPLSGVVPDPVGHWLRSVQPEALPGQLAGRDNAYTVFDAGLSPIAALAVLFAYPVLLLGIGARRAVRRDA
jgi:ABC-2 type transport system permease protein